MMTMRVRIHVVLHKMVLPSVVPQIPNSRFSIPFFPIAVTHFSRSSLAAFCSLVQLGLLPCVPSTILLFFPSPIPLKMGGTSRNLMTKTNLRRVELVMFASMIISSAEIMRP